VNFTEKEKELSLQLKQKGIQWKPQEGDWFWSAEDFSHHFYLGENLPASYFFQKGEAYLFDSSMLWHLQQGGLKISSFVWLPTWEFCRSFLKNKGYRLQIQDQTDGISLSAQKNGEEISFSAFTDLEAVYHLLTQIQFID
jgi:hypothetical protein